MVTGNGQDHTQVKYQINGYHVFVMFVLSDVNTITQEILRGFHSKFNQMFPIVGAHSGHILEAHRSGSRYHEGQKSNLR